MEFALTVPLMLVLWLGMAEVMQISMANAKTSQAAQSVADLVSRYSTSGYSDPQGFNRPREAAAGTIIAPLAVSTGHSAGRRRSAPL